MTDDSAAAVLGRGRRSPSGLRRTVLVLVLGVSALYTVPDLDRGWIPHDEGTLAHSAERVLRGELPHRDFDDVYTGGLSALNAVAFRVFGVNLLTPRIVLFGFFLAWVPALFYVSTRFVGPLAAALAVPLAVVWSIPNYPAAMPSWYNLFFAVFGLAALLKHVESGDRVWLFAAGLAGGLSVLMKTAGLFFVAAGLLFLGYREQSLSRAASAGNIEDEVEDAPPRGATANPSPGYSLFASGALLLFMTLLVLLVGGRSGAAGVVWFIAPLGALSAFVLRSEWVAGPGVATAGRFRTLLHLGLPFVGGVLVPVGALILVYVANGAAGDLVRGLFVLPTRRFAMASFAPPPLVGMWAVLPLVALLAAEPVLPPRVRKVLAGLIALGAALAVVVPGAGALLPTFWGLLNGLGPVVVLAGVGLVVWWKPIRKPVASQQAFAVLAVAGGVMLVQFPFSGAIYLFYALPALVPAGLVALAGSPSRERPMFLAVMFFLLVFSARWINTGELFAQGNFAYDPTVQTARLELDRGGNLRVSPEEKEEYERLVRVLRELSTSPYTYATPDAPEVYFLSGLRNPTATLYEFFDDPREGEARVPAGLDSLGVNVVALNTGLRFSGPPSPELLEALRRRYPRATRVGRFIVRWR